MGRTWGSLCTGRLKIFLRKRKRRKSGKSKSLVFFFKYFFTAVFRLAERKERRAIEQKMLNVKRLGESDDEEDDAKKWVKKIAEKEKQKKAADDRVNKIN